MVFMFSLDISQDLFRVPIWYNSYYCVAVVKWVMIVNKHDTTVIKNSSETKIKLTKYTAQPQQY